jgi:hypothetical protein
MPFVRTITVGFQGANRKIEKVSVDVPAAWVSGDRDALFEIEHNERLRTRLAVTPGTALWAEIGEPWNPDEGGGFFVG